MKPIENVPENKRSTFWEHNDDDDHADHADDDYGEERAVTGTGTVRCDCVCCTLFACVGNNKQTAAINSVSRNVQVYIMMAQSSARAARAVPVNYARVLYGFCYMYLFSVWNRGGQKQQAACTAQQPTESPVYSIWEYCPSRLVGRLPLPPPPLLRPQNLPVDYCNITGM